MTDYEASCGECGCPRYRHRADFKGGPEICYARKPKGQPVQVFQFICECSGFVEPVKDVVLTAEPLT